MKFTPLPFTALALIILSHAWPGAAWDGPRRARAAVFVGPLPTSAPTLGRVLERQLRDAGYETEVIGAEVLTNQGRLVAGHYGVLALPDARSLPVASVGPIEAYLKTGGSLVALGAPAWESPLYRVQGQWISKAAYEERLSAQKAQHRIEYFTDSKLPGWWRSSNDMQTKASYLVEPDGGGPVLHASLREMAGWDTFISPHLDHPFPAGHTLTCFRARGGPHTRQLALEWGEMDGSRWIAVVNLTTEWKQYALPPQAFKTWESPGRGGRGDCFNPSQADHFSVGLAVSHTALQGPEQAYWFAELGSALNPFGGEALSSVEVPRLESLSPGYQFFDITTPVLVRADDLKAPLEDWERDKGQAVFLEPGAAGGADAGAPGRVLGLHPRPRGVGFRQDRPLRWEPLLGAYDRRTGEYRGAVAAMVVHLAPPFRGGVWAVFTPGEARFYEQPLVTNCLRQVLSRMRRGLFLAEGGSEFFTLFPGQALTVGAEVVNFGPTTVSNLTLSVQAAWSHGGAGRGAGVGRGLLERSFALGPGQTTRYDQGELGQVDQEERVSTLLRCDGRRVDALSHELGVWQPKAAPEFIRAADGGLWLGGKPWKAHGVNYMPSTGIGVANEHFFEHWVGRGSYDPEVIERDLRRAKAMNLNAVSVFIAYESLSAQNLLDFLRRCERLGLRVNQSLRPGTPLDFRWEEMKGLIEFYRMAQNDTIFAYDLAWEPSHYDHNSQEREYAGLWQKWVAARYGSLEQAERAWGAPAPLNPTNAAVVGVPPMAQLLNDGLWRKLAADYRRFLDEHLERHYAEARRLVTSIDRHHAVSFRMQLAGDPTVLLEGLLPYDFYGLARAVDIWEPEGYGRIGDWGRVKGGEFTAAYARLCDPGKPLVWAEMGFTVWDMNRMAPDPDKLAVQARFYSDFYRMLTESGADGVFSWWYPGGLRLNEGSDFGIINPDGTDRPVTEVIRRRGAEFLAAPKPGKPDYWIPVSRDKDARGLYGIYAAVGKEFWAAVAAGHRPGLKWEGPPGGPGR